MQLVDPGLTSVFYWRIKEDDLVLYPNFMHDRLQRHAALQNLETF